MNFHEKILNQNKTFDEIANPSESHKGIINLIVKEKQNKKIEHKNKDNEAISTQRFEDTENNAMPNSSIVNIRGIL